MSRLLLIALAWLYASAVFSQSAPGPGQYDWEEFGKRIKKSQEVPALGPELMGDHVSLANGALTFRVTDVSLPGNNTLAVEFSRSYSLFNRRDYPVENTPLGDWELDTPSISAVFNPDWEVGNPLTKNRCTSADKPLVSGFSLSDFWQGPEIRLQGGGGGELLRTRSTTLTPSDGPTYYWVTNDQVHVHCLPSIQNDSSGEGFVAVTPDGTRYRFDWMAQTGEAPLKSLKIELGGSRSWDDMDRRKNYLYATRVEDRFGNYVDYTYTNAWNQPPRLTQISSSDGRTITVNYTNNRISSVSDGVRTWTYAYGMTPGRVLTNAPNQPQRPTLTTVTLPDYSSWTIDFSQFTDAILYYNEAPGGEILRTCRINELPLNYAEQPTGTITHPSGAQGVFVTDIREHGRASVPLNCSNVRLIGGPGGGRLSNHPADDVNLHATAYYAFTLKQKSLSGPATTPATWEYSYTPNKSVHLYPGVTFNYPVCTLGLACADPPCTSESCASASVTTVTGPNGEWVRYRHGNTYGYNEGKLLNIESGTGPGNILRTVVNTYDLSVTDTSTYPAWYGASLRLNNDGFANHFPRPLLSTQTIQQGTSFLRTHQTLDYFARPTTTRRESATGHKTESYTYEDNTSKWVMGQIKTVTCLSASQPGCTGQITAAATYDPVHASQLTYSAFGQVLQTLTYNTSASIASGQRGTVSTIQDGHYHTTTLANWYRGVPQLVTHPDATSQQAVVNSHGWITQVTDELFNSTNYGYDSLGRLTSITWPTGDSTVWTSTSRSFTKSFTAAYGIAAGHWQMTETTGNAVKVTYLNAMWQPVLTREYDSTDPSGTERFIKRSFDGNGRETFASYPGASSNPTDGTWTLYDALGRAIQRSQSSEIGTLLTTTEFLTGSFATRVTNPRGYQTTTYYQTLDEPTLDYPVSLSEPGGVSTYIDRDAYGKPTAITRSGYWNSAWQSATRHFVYDAQQRLCKRVDPESGASILDYDAAGNLAWSARHGTLTSTSDCQRASVPSGSRSWRTYDTRNRLTAVDHPAGTADESYSYHADGALFTASTTDGGVWTYGYNKRRLPTAETLSIDGKTFAIGYAYNSLGQVNTLTYPSGLSVSFNPNALGQPRQVGSYASSATYHPDGSLAGFSYGNGIVHSRTRNTRGLPSRMWDSLWGVSRFDHSYTYDAHGNLTQLTDGVDYSENRFMAYDARDRLIEASAPYLYGEEIFDYDALDNVRRAAIYPLGGGSYLLDYRFVYDANQRLDRINDAIGTLLWDYSHNALGETTWRSGAGNTWSYAWSAAGRMTQGGNESYVYDAHGHRSRATRSGTGSTRYQIHNRSGKLLYVEDSRDDQRIDYLHLGSKLIAQRSRPLYGSTATVTYHHTDHLGSASVETNASGTQTQRTLRTPYGSPYDGTYREGPGFAGHVTDTATNLTYMQQRYYDPVAMRFISVDPVDVSAANGGNFNRYWYANNNSYRFTDPDGRWVEDLVIGVPSMVVGAVSLVENVAAGNIAGAAIDAAGIIADVAAIATPGVPGGAGLAINAGRAADKVADVARIGDNALVVRGGSAAGANSAEGIAKGTGTHPAGVTGFSAESANGTTLCQLCANVAHNQVGVTTAGQVRAAGGDVVATGGVSPTHVTVTGLSPQQANSLLTPTQTNPVPRDQRRQFDQTP